MQRRPAWLILAAFGVFAVIRAQADTLYKQGNTVLGPVNIVQCSSGIDCFLDGGMVSLTAGSSVWLDAGPSVNSGSGGSVPQMAFNQIYTPNVISNPDAGPGLFVESRGQNAGITTRPYFMPSPTIVLANDNTTFRFPTIEFRDGLPPTSGGNSSLIFNSNTDFPPYWTNPPGPVGFNSPGPQVGLNFATQAATFFGNGTSPSAVMSIKPSSHSVDIYDGVGVRWVNASGVLPGTIGGSWEQFTLADGGSLNSLVADNLRVTSFGLGASNQGHVRLGDGWQYAFPVDGGNTVTAGSSLTFPICPSNRRAAANSYCIPSFTPNTVGTRQSAGIFMTCTVSDPTVVGSGIVCLDFTFHNYSAADANPVAGTYRALVIDDITNAWMRQQTDGGIW